MLTNHASGPASSEPAISIQAVSKTFGHFKALEQVSLAVEPGDCCLLLGSNGAGKTTLLRLVGGLSRPTDGTICIHGKDVRAQPAEARAQIGFLSHAPQLYSELSARENLRFFGRLCGLGDLEERVQQILEWVELKHRGDDLVRTFSRGMQQRVSIAKAFLHDPQLLLLDEPHSGLDPYAVGVLNRLLGEFHRQGRTLVITTHNLELPLQFASRLAILRRGKLAHFAAISGISSAELRELFDTYR